MSQKSQRRRKEQDANELPSRVLAMCAARGLGARLLHEPLVVGVSGGADSLALLHILLALRSGEARETIHVGHLDHGFRGADSAADMEFVARVCREWAVGFTTKSFDVSAYAGARRLSPEDAARRARYAFLGRLARERNSTVVVAHTADDQAETVLMNVIRGSGISGLGGMRWLSGLPPLHDDEFLSFLSEGISATTVHIFRPLLGTWREEIEAYCEANALDPRHDASNLDPAFSRNRVRHELIPLMSSHYNRAVKRHLWQLAETAAEEDDAMEGVVTGLWPTLATNYAAGRVQLDLPGLEELPAAIKRRIARRALREVAGTLEGFEHGHIARVAWLFSPAAPVRTSADLPNGISLERRGDTVSLGPRGGIPLASSTTGSSFWPAMEQGASHDLVAGQDIELDSGWKLGIGVGPPLPLDLNRDNLTAQFDHTTLGTVADLVVRTRRPGDQITPIGLGGTKSLQDLFIDAKIPVHHRETIPLLALRDSSEVLWVPGRGGRRSSHAPVGHETASATIFRFERQSPSEGEE